MTSIIFSSSSSNYARLYLEYYKSNYSLVDGKKYTINVPGLLPQMHYSRNLESSTFAIEDEKIEESNETCLGRHGG